MGAWDPVSIGVWAVQRGRFSGLYREKDSFLYVSNGQSNWGPRVRLYSRPENTLITLRNSRLFALEGKEVDLSWRRENYWAIAGIILIPGWVIGSAVVHVMERRRTAWWLPQNSANQPGVNASDPKLVDSVAKKSDELYDDL